MRAAMLLFAVFATTVQMAAWERTPPTYCIDFCKGGLGEVCVNGWAYDPYHGDLDIIIVASTQPNKDDEGYEEIMASTLPPDGDEIEGYPIERFFVDGISSAHNITGNCGFSARLPVYNMAYLFGESDELIMYVKIYARTFEYNPSNPHHDEYQYLLNKPFTAVSVVRNTGDGTKDAPYIIDNAKHWDAIANVIDEADISQYYIDKYFQLSDEEGFEYNDATPVTKMFGTSIRPFAGIFDGKGKTLTVNLTGATAVAPFSFTEGATIRNLTVAGNITASQSAGGIVGDGGSSWLNLENCVCSATISGFTNYAGGLMGWTEEDMKLNIKNCLFKGSFTPGSGGKCHPIACKDGSKTVMGNIVRAFYLNSVSPSAELGNNIIVRAKGVPLSAQRADGEWDEPITVADGQEYYAPHFTGKRLDYSYMFGSSNLSEEGWTYSDEHTIVNGEFHFQRNIQPPHPQYLISPEFDGYDAVTLSFSYDLGYRSPQYDLTFQVGYSTTSNDIDAFTWDDEITVLRPTQGYFEQYQKDFPSDIKYFAVKCHESRNALNVKDFNFTACIYPSPTDIAVSKMTEEATTLTWTAPDAVYPATGYSYQYKKASDGDWPDECMATTLTTVDLSDLSPNTDYNFRVRANYDNASSNYLPIDFTSAVSLPYFCGFENVTVSHGMEQGWRMANCEIIYLEDTDYGPGTGVRSFAQRTGENGFHFSNSPNYYPQYLISPRLPENTPITLSFYYKDDTPEGNTSIFAKFKVGYSTTNSDYSAFTWGDEISVRAMNWTEFNATFPEGTRYIAVVYSEPAWGLYMDDFNFESYSYKPKPIDLAVSDLTDQSATFTWTAPNASVADYTYKYKKGNEDNWQAETTINATSVTIGNLDANTAYDFRVKAHYSDGVSNDVAVRFITEGTAVNFLPHTDGFEEGLGGWRVVDAHTLTTLYTKKAENIRTGNCSFQIYPKDKPIAQYLISPQLDVQGPIKISFYHKGYEDYPTFFQVGYSTTTKEDVLEDFKWQTRCLTGSDWQEYTAYCPEGTKYFAIRWYYGYFLYLDDFTFETTITPTKPENLAATDATATSANLSWTGNAGKFELKYREKPLFFEDFENGINHWFMLEKTGNVFNFFNAQEVQNPTSWECSNWDGNHVATAKNQVRVTSNGSIIAEDILEVDDWLTSPLSTKLPLTGTLSFRALFYSEGPDECEVLVSTDDRQTYTTIGSIGSTYNYSHDLSNYFFDLDSFNGQEGYIAFRYQGKKDIPSMLAIDDVGIFPSYSEWTTIETTEHNVIVNGLKPNTEHEFQVKSLLYNYSSGWTDRKPFTTDDFKLLAENADNSATISAIADGKKHDVILQGHTLYRDRNWNTLCLPFDVVDGNSSDDITFSGTPLEGAIVKELGSTDYRDGILTLNFTDASPSGDLVEAGKPYIIKWANGADLVINNDSEWKDFVGRVDQGETFAGKNVALGNHINVSTEAMVGTADNPFCGTFDGNGYTLNLSIDDSGADYAAPFRYINGANIRNVKVTGSVNGGNHCAGIVGAAQGGTNNILNCWMGASVTGPSNIGGVLGHGNASVTTIANCYLSGDLMATNIGVFYGWGSEGGTHTLATCWATGTYAYNVTNGSINLLRSDGGTVTVTNCCHNNEYIQQGERMIVLYNSTIVNHLGSQWTTDSNWNLMLKPSADIFATNIVNPVFKRVTVSNNDPTPATFTEGQFVGTYSPVSNGSDMLLDAHNTDNGAFHAVYSYDRSALGEGFVNWYSDATLTTPATVIPFDADGNATLHAGMWMELANASDNSATIESAVSSGRTNGRTVVLKDRTLYRDDNWNTLCLPFSMSIDQIAASPIAGVTIMELNGTTSNLTNGTLTLNFNEAFSIEAGRPYIVKWQHPTIVINDADGWNSFAEAVNEGTTSYAGKLVQLGADINVSTMVGTAEHPFCGTFDGNGHTLNVSIDDSGADYAAPFRYIRHAFIRNVKVTGSVSGGNHCAGIVGAALGGTNSIRSCWMVASVTGQSNIGGILGHGNASATTIANCYLNGNLHATNIGVFYGGGSEGGTHTVATCWATGTYTYPVNTGSICLLRASGGTATVANCYHNSEWIQQGEQAIALYVSNIVDHLGSQWSADSNGQLTLKPSVAIGNTDIEHPVFTGVNIDNSAEAQARQTVTFAGGSFCGTYSPVALPVDDQSNLFLGANNTLYWPNGANSADGNYYINSCRAYFHISNGSTVRQLQMNYGGEESTMGVISLAHTPSPKGEGSIYTTDGRYVGNNPARLPKGVYVVGGKKFIVR